MNPSSHPNSTAQSTPPIEQQRMLEPLMNANLNGLQAMFQLAALFNQNPLGGVGLPVSSPLVPPATPQQTQFQQPTPPPQSLPSQGAPNLLSLLGVQGNGFATSALGTSNSVGGPVGSCGDDDEILIRALRESNSKGSTYRQALEGLHGVSKFLTS